MSINLDGGSLLEEKAKIFNREVFPRCLRASHTTLVITACGDHVARGAVGWSTYYFPNEVHLPRGDHVADARDGVKHPSYFVVVERLFANFGHRYLKDAADAAM